VTNLGLFAGSQQIGAATSSPFQLALNNVPAGSYSLTAHATDNEGAVGVSTPVNITVLPAHSPPMIVTQPLSQQVPVGAGFSLSVQAYGPAPLAYQWQLNSTNLPGETNAHLSIANAQSGNAGVYLATVTNPYGQTNSAPAAVSLFSSSLLFTTVQAGPGGTLRLGLSAPLGTLVSIETTTNLPSWTLLQQLTVTNQNMEVSYPLDPPPATRLFRLSMP
jgi:hypothetical protein